MRGEKFKMAKFYGPVGYKKSMAEVRPGIWDCEIEERFYGGDFTRNSSRFQTADKVNDDVNVTNEISIVADPFAYANFHNIQYVGYMGAKWKVTGVEVKHPRLILTIGGVYNEQAPGIA